MYRINECLVKNEDGKDIKSYGVSCDLKAIEDINTDKNKVQKFVDDLNRLEVSPIHMDEVVEDFVAEISQ